MRAGPQRSPHAEANAHTRAPKRGRPDRRRGIAPALAPGVIHHDDSWRSGDGLVIDRQRRLMYAIDDRAGAIVRSHLDTHAREVWPSGGAPTQLLVGTDGSLFVTDRQAGTVALFSADHETLSVTLGGEPYGLAGSPDGRTVFVTLATKNEVVALAARDLSIQWRQTVADQPRPIAWAAGDLLLIGHLKASPLTVLDARHGGALGVVPLDNGPGGRRSTQVLEHREHRRARVGRASLRQYGCAQRWDPRNRDGRTRP